MARAGRYVPFLSQLLFLLPFLLLLGNTSESYLCGSVEEVKLQPRGRASAISLTLANEEQNAFNEPCTLNIFAPNVVSLSLRLIDVENPFIDFGKILPSKWGSKRRIEKINHGDKKTNKTIPDCILNVYYINEAESTNVPMWRMTPCSSEFSILKSSSQLMSPPIKIEWWPSQWPYHTDHLRLIVTAVNTDKTCLSDDQVTCSSPGAKPLLCISNALACDGVKHCPGGNGEDEANSLCAQRKSNWVEELINRLASKHGEFLGIDMITSRPSKNVTKNHVQVVKEAGKPRKGLSALDAALEPYGTWGYLMLGMLICATVLIIFGVWECFCHYSRTHQDQSMPPDCVAPAAIICSSQPQHWRPYPPPTYDELEPPPPSYSVLFPQSDKDDETPSTSTEESPDTPTENSVNV